ncbi:hypothetical protein Misp01_31660 [Microtetraspora sp. NBRC 13810]|uniref:hypothetical protein n=1 Tax=Microtetraspora sp. NBRC 13810 TaxID=3030990 RepID=UPI0024A55BB2|nr:hypothetical protein [Microtetraspora sp. NBRC 13810]GLW08036.1 hypothetical protein Misp01_31660 [Microtetraspora sp. NBRC 13810]
MVEDMYPPGWFRAVRAGSFALVCVGLSQAGHDLMAPRAVPAWSVVAAFCMVAATGYRLAAREWSTGWILAAMEAAQLYLHVWFAWTTPADPLPGVTVLHHGAHLATTAHQAPDMAAHAGMTGPAMFAAHALAGAMVALWLAKGEQALWRALGAFARLLAGLGWMPVLLKASPAPAGPAPARRTAGDEGVPPAEVLRHALVRRGPPRSPLIRIASV